MSASSMTTVNGQKKALNTNLSKFIPRDTSSKRAGTDAASSRADRFDNQALTPGFDQRIAQTAGGESAPTAGAPVISAPTTAIPESTQKAILELKLPAGAYNAEVRVNGGLTVNEEGDVKAGLQAGYYGQRVQAVLRGEAAINLQGRSDGSTATEFSLGGGVVIGLGPRARDPGAVNAQNTVVSDLQTLASNADRLAGEIGRSEMTADQKEVALEGVGNQLSGELLRGLLVAQNVEKGDLPRGLVNQLSLSMGGLISTNDPFVELDKRYAAIGRQSPFPRSAAEAVMAAADAVNAAGENLTSASDAGVGQVNTIIDTPRDARVAD